MIWRVVNVGKNGVIIDKDFLSAELIRFLTINLWMIKNDSESFFR